MKRGFSTLELLIAFSVLTLGLTAVVMVAFGNQSYAIDSALSQRALLLAKTNLEATRATAFADFSALQSFSDAHEEFTSEIKVTDVSICNKRVESLVSWNQGLRELDATLTYSLVDTQAAAAVGYDCATEEPEDDWQHPGILLSEALPSQTNPTALDELQHFIYVTADPEVSESNDFYVYELDPFNTSITGSPTYQSLNTSSGYDVGLFDVDVAYDLAYVASGSTTAQLQVIDVSDPTSIEVVATASLPGVNPDGSYPEGRVVHFSDNRVYLGTKETSGPEFHIFDVSSLPPQHLASLELTHNVNEIRVYGDYAYLATSDNTAELMVINISSLSALLHPDITNLKFDAPGNNDGTSVAVGSDQIYLGRAQSSDATDSFYILDKQVVLDNTQGTDGQLSAKEIGITRNARIADITVSGTLAFLALNDPNLGLAIYDISQPEAPELTATCAQMTSKSNSVAMDIDDTGSFVFMIDRLGGTLNVVNDQNLTCP